MVVEQVRRIIGATPVAGIIGALSAMRDRPDSRDLLAGLRDIPTLVIGGEQDELMAPSATKEMAEAIPGAQLRIVPGAGHLPSLEQPRLTTQAITEFLEKLG
jgi:pimeloyl-ACP methyl ester carboxylesterase